MSNLDVTRDINFKYGAANLGTAAVAVTGTATVRGGSADLATYQGAGVVFCFSTLTGSGTATPVVYESDDGLTFTATAAADLTRSVSTVAGIGSATMSGSNDTTAQVIGYTGSKRYIAPGLQVSGTPAVTVSAHVVATGRGVSTTGF